MKKILYTFPNALQAFFMFYRRMTRKKWFPGARGIATSFLPLSRLGLATTSVHAAEPKSELSCNCTLVRVPGQEITLRTTAKPEPPEEGWE